jgi:hypothetical protein
MIKLIKKGAIATLAVSSVALFSGCGLDSAGANSVGNNLVSSEIIENIDSSVMLSVVKASIDPNATNAFGYKAVKINYNTTNQAGKSVVASGLLVIPSASDDYQA